MLCLHRGTQPPPPPSHAGSVYLATRQSGGRSVSEVRGEGGLTGCAPQLCANTEIGMGSLEAAVTTLAARPGGDRLPYHQGQLTLEHLHHHHHHHLLQLLA